MLRFIQEHHLIAWQQPLLVAVSGGPDSVCLLHVLVKLQGELGTGLHVGHLDHQLRGAESAADADYVSCLARQLGVPATVERRDVKAYQASRHLSLEEAAREVRYDFLAEVAGAIGATQVATGHTRDDHVETILMHLLRGTGTRGLRGLQPGSRWPYQGGSLTVVRPLLQLSRQETASYCRCYNLNPRIDASNLSLSPLRNRLRLQLLPLLQGYNPRIIETLVRTGRIAEDDYAFLDRESARLRREIIQKEEGVIILDKQKFLELPPALKRHLLRVAMEELLGDPRDIEARHIEQVMDALNKPAGKRLSLPGGLAFSLEYDRYLLGADADAVSPFPVLDADFSLHLPGETLLPGWRVQATVMSPSEIKETGLAGGPFAAYFDLDKAGDKLAVRGRRPGDRFQPLGMSQPKKVGEFMVDARIPHAWRQRVPIVCSPGQILWVVGWRIDDRVKVTEATEQILCLEFERG